MVHHRSVKVQIGCKSVRVTCTWPIESQAEISGYSKPMNHALKKRIVFILYWVTSTPHSKRADLRFSYISI